jgi:hypothetical protein
MSTAVKTLIILILIASLGLMYTTMVQYATRENWKRRWDQDTRELKKDLDSRDQTLANTSMGKAKAEAQVVALNAQVSDQQGTIKKLENDNTVAEGRIHTLDRDLNKARQDYNALNENYMTAQRSLEMVRSRNAELTQISQVSRAVAHNLNVKLAEVEDDLNNAQADLAKRAQENSELDREKKRYAAMIALLRERHPVVYNELVDQKASTRFIEGVVAQVRPNPEGKQDVVMLTVGQADGVEEGLEFIIYRGKEYVVKVRAEKVMNGQVACRVLANTWNDKNLQIQPGDLAANRL